MVPKQPTDNEVFNFARKLGSGESLTEYLDQVCGDDAPRRAKILDLIAADQRDSFLEKPPVAIPETIGSQSSLGLEGQVIGNYKLLQRIGEGGFGTVYMAEQTAPVRRKVALKIIKPGMDTKEVIARFEAERQALAMMDHPNIAKVFDGGQTDSGHPYFVMELVKGVPLTRFCDENRLDTRARLGLFEDVCNAIQHAHQKGIIHRDIKPSNVLVTLHDGKPVPKVIDFGVSKAISQQLTGKTLFTKYGQMIGTPQYMSPEQAEMSGLDVDTRSDIYSLGVLLYELLTGTTPIDPVRFRQTGYAEMQRMIREEEPLIPSKRLSTLSEQSTRIASNRGVDLRSLSSTVRGELDWIVMKALEKDRNRRYETARGLSLDIDRYLRDEAVVASPPSSLYQLRKFARRNRTVLATITMIGMALIVGIGIATWQAVRARSAEGVARREGARASAEAVRAGQALANEETKRRELQQQKYISDMNAASLAYREGDFVRIRDLLANYTEGSDTADLRKFEWYFLSRICGQLDAVPSIKLPNAARVARFSHDDRYIIVAELTGEISVYRTGDLTDRNETAPRAINSIRRTDGPHWSYFLRSHPTRNAVVFPASKDTVVLWDFETGKETRFEDANVGNGRINDVVFTSDGDHLVTGASSGGITVWDLKTGQPSQPIPMVGNAVTALAFGSKEAILATAETDGEVVVWDLASGKALRRHDFGPMAVQCLAFSPSDDRLAVGVGTQIHIYDLEKEAVAGILSGHDRHFESMTFLPNGQSLISAGYDNTVRIWDTTTFSPLTNVRGHSGYVFSVDIAKNASAFLTASKDSTVRLWNLDRVIGPSVLQCPAANGREAVNQVNWVLGVQFDPLDSHAVIASLKYPIMEMGSTIIRWNLETSRREQLNLDLAFRGFAASMTGAIASISRSHGVQLLSRVDGSGRLEREDVAGTRAAFSFDGRYLATSKGDGEIDLLDALTLESVWPEPKQTECSVRSMAFSPDDRLFVVGGDDGQIRLIDVESGGSLESLSGHQGRVISLAFSHDGQQLASAGYDHKILVWNCNDWNATPKTLRGHTASVRALRFGLTGSTLYSAGSDRTIKLWDVASSQVRFTIFNDQTVECLDLSTDGRTLVSGGRDSAIRVWRSSDPE